MDSPHTRLKLIRPPQTAGLLGWSACCCINSCCCKCISCNSCIVNNENFGNLDIECSHTWFNKPFNATKKVIKSRLTCSQHWLSCICGSELAAAAKIKWCLDSLTLRLQRPEWIYLEKNVSAALPPSQSRRGCSSTTIPSEYANTGNRLLIKCPGVRWNELLKRYC